MSSTPQSAAIYTRISKDSNGQGLGVDRQKELCEKLAAEKGWQIGQVYVDNDVSAYLGASRPQYEKMLADLEAGAVDGVLVVDQDRLTRQPMELETFIIAADKAGVPIANVSGEIDLSTSDGRFRARILGAVSRQESEKKSERHRRQKDESASKGWHPGGRRPYGYTHARTPEGIPTLEIIESEAVIVREMAARIVAGDSARQIAIDLNERGIPTANGKKWQSTTVRQILTKPSTAGLRVHHGEVVGEGNWPPLVDRATWETLKAVFADNRRRQGGTPKVKHLLAGILTCARCGTTLRHSPRGNYACDPPPRSCGRISISEAVEPIIVDRVLDRLAEADIFTAIAEAPPADVIITEIEAGEKALDQLAKDYYAPQPLITRREFMAARDAVEARLAELRAQLPAVNRPVDIELPQDRDQLAEVWSEMPLDERRRILHLVIDEAIVHPGVRGRQTVDPARLEIRWRERL